MLQRHFLTLPRRCQLTSAKLSLSTNWPRRYNQSSDVVFSSFLFLSRLSFTSIHDSQNNREGGGAISLTPPYHFHPLHRHLDISRAITAESSPLPKASSRTRIVNLWFLKVLLTTKLRALRCDNLWQRLCVC